MEKLKKNNSLILMEAIVKIKKLGDRFEKEFKLVPDQPVNLFNQRPGGKPFNWVGTILGIEVKISNDERYDSQLKIDPQLDPYRSNIAKAISVALKEWD